MTRQQFFQINQTQLSVDRIDHPRIDRWAAADMVVTGVGKTSYSIRKHGLIEVQKARPHHNPRTYSAQTCSPRYLDVHEYEEDHNTPPKVFFDEVQINLLRVAVRTLGSTRSNDAGLKLGLEMANHTLL